MREAVSENKIAFVGNVMIDSLGRQRKRGRELGVPAMRALSESAFAMMTLHRSENMDVPAVLSGILVALGRIQDTHPLSFTYILGFLNALQTRATGSAPDSRTALPRSSLWTTSKRVA